MHSAIIHDPRSGLTPTILRFADERRARLIRMQPKPLASVVKSIVEIQEPAAPPVPNALFEEAWTMLERRRHTSAFKCEYIQREVLRHFPYVNRMDLIGQRRTANVVLPRQIAMYLCKTLTPRSLPDIGRRFGGRDHTTVLHAVRKVTALIQSRPDVAEMIASITAALQPQSQAEV